MKRTCWVEVLEIKPTDDALLGPGQGYLACLDSLAPDAAPLALAGQVVVPGEASGVPVPGADLGAGVGAAPHTGELHEAAEPLAVLVSLALARPFSLKSRTKNNQCFNVG